MTKIKFGDKEYKIQFGYIATAKSGIISKLIKTENSLGGDNIEDSIGDFLLLIPELALVGLQKFHRDEFGYNYDTGEGKEKALEKAGELVDSYFDIEGADIKKLMDDLKGELMDNSFLSKMFQEEQENQEKEQEQKQTQNKQKKAKEEN